MSLCPTIPSNGYTCIKAAAANDTTVASCSGHDICNAAGTCVCQYPPHYCSTTHYEDVPASIQITCLFFSFLIFSVCLCVYLTEFIVDIRHFGCSLFKKSALIAKLGIILNCLFNLAFLSCLAAGYYYDNTFYGSISYDLEFIAIVMLLASHTVSGVRWYEMLLKMKEVGRASETLRIARFVVIVILCITLPATLITYILTSLPLGASYKAISTYIGGFGSVIGFGAATLLTTVFLIKSSLWFRKVAFDNESKKLKRLYTKSITLIVANIVVTGIYIWSLVASVVLPPGSINATNRNFYVTPILESIVVVILFVFLQSHWW